MSDKNTGVIVETEWLAERLGRPGLRVVDATWFLPTEDRDPRDEFLRRHIPGAVFFDIDAIADASTDLPHMLPDEAAFAAAVGALGIGSGDTIVVYDAQGVYSAPRVWWTFRVFDHVKVAVLNGGLPKWLAEGRPVAAGGAKPAAANFTARLRPEPVRDVAAMQGLLERNEEQILDARSAGRFAGREPEPRPGVRPGHIPGALSLPYTEIVDGGSLKPPEALAAAFARAGVDTGRPVVTSCGSGLTACILGLALSRLGHDDWAVYDGSWAEWGGRHDLPIEGEA